jgi:hypothetical protein
VPDLGRGRERQVSVPGLESALELCIGVALRHGERMFADAGDRGRDRSERALSLPGEQVPRVDAITLAAGHERGASDDLPEQHAGPAPSDLQRALPPGGAGRL